MLVNLKTCKRMLLINLTNILLKILKNAQIRKIVKTKDLAFLAILLLSIGFQALAIATALATTAAALGIRLTSLTDQSINSLAYAAALRLLALLPIQTFSLTAAPFDAVGAEFDLTKATKAVALELLDQTLQLPLQLAKVAQKSDKAASLLAFSNIVFAIT